MGTQEGAKRDQNRSQEGIFLNLKRHKYNKWSWNAFLVVLGAPWRSKNDHFILEGLQKSAFQEVAFLLCFETGLGGTLDAKLEPI